MVDPITSTASKDIADSPELKKLEQAVTEAGETETTETFSDTQETETSPLGQAFQDLAEKKGFKSVDDLVEAYKNAESYSTKTSQELKSIREEIKSLKTPPQQDPYQNLPDDQRQALVILEQVIDKAVSKRLQPLQEDLEVRRAGNKIEAVKGQYPELSDSDINSALDLMEETPSLSLENAIKVATYDKVRTGSQLNQRKAEKTQQKERAFVESAKTSKTGDVDYSKLTLDELESLLPASGQFVDSKGVLRK